MSVGRAPPSRVGRLLGFLIRGLIRSTARIRIEGAGNLPDQGAFLVVANHLSNVDPPLVAAFLEPGLGRRIRFLAKEQLFDTPLAPLLRHVGAIPVRAGGRDVEAFRAARRALEGGEIVAIFPEGTRSRTGRLGRLHPGAGLLAARSGVPVVPIGLIGTDRLLGPGSWLPRVGTPVTVRIGKPFRLEPEVSADRRSQVTQATDRIMDEIARLLPGQATGPATAERDAVGSG